MRIVGITLVICGSIWLFNIVTGDSVPEFLSIIPPICLIFAGGWLLKTGDR